MRHFTQFIFVLLPVFFIFSACASSPAKKSGASPAGSSVWKISKDGRSLFLAGSVHILRAEDFPLPAEFDRAYAASDMLVLEADLEKLAEPELAILLLTGMALPEGKTLQTILEPDTYKRLKERCAEYGILLEQLAQFKPIMILTTLYTIQVQQAGFIQQGVDLYYFNAAKEDSKAMGFLETAEEQIAVLASTGDGYENDYVKYTLDDIDNTMAETVALVSEWKQGKAALIEAGLEEMQEQWPVIYQTLLKNRNDAWMSRLISFFDTDPVEMVVVGLAHLHGPDGLLRLLEDSGCTVEQYR